jgi:hypothetical protein
LRHVNTFRGHHGAKYNFHEVCVSDIQQAL